MSHSAREDQREPQAPRGVQNFQSASEMGRRGFCLCHGRSPASMDRDLDGAVWLVPRRHVQPTMRAKSSGMSSCNLATHVSAFGLGVQDVMQSRSFCCANILGVPGRLVGWLGCLTLP